MSCEIVTLSSGARAMRCREVGEVMHPFGGPLVEPRRYVAAARVVERLAEGAPDPLVVLDVGLGAGGNALATLEVALAGASRALELVSFDRDVEALALALAEPTAFGLDGVAGTATRAVIEHGVWIHDRVRWRTVLGELPGVLPMEPIADVVFWDPFSPRANPSLWTVAAFSALRRACRPGATVHTYGGATATRSALLLAGFAVGIGDAVDGGREGTVAALDARDLARPLDRRWLERLGRSSAPWPLDAPPDARERVAAAAQFNA